MHKKDPRPSLQRMIYHQIEVTIHESKFVALFIYCTIVQKLSVKIWVQEDKWFPKALIFGLGKIVQMYLTFSRKVTL